MTNFLSGLRSRGSLGSARARSPWQRSKALLRTIWNPYRGKDASLPQWVHLLVGLSDDGLRIPGTSVRLGLDAVLGMLLPGAGDALGGVTSAALMYVAWRRGAPGALLFRMLGNATLDIAFGSIPIVGDIFDLGFHANRRNLSMLEGFLDERLRSQRASRWSAVLVFALLLAVLSAALAGAVLLLLAVWQQVLH
jgi:Domain of unknown function (DUF4112)